MHVTGREPSVNEWQGHKSVQHKHDDAQDFKYLGHKKSCVWETAIH